MHLTPHQRTYPFQTSILSSLNRGTLITRSGVPVIELAVHHHRQLLFVLRMHCPATRRDRSKNGSFGRSDRPLRAIPYFRLMRRRNVGTSHIDPLRRGDPQIGTNVANTSKWTLAPRGNGRHTRNGWSQIPPPGPDGNEPTTTAPRSVSSRWRMS